MSNGSVALLSCSISVDFWKRLPASPEQRLDSSGTLDKFPSTDSGDEEYWGVADNAKTDFVVAVVALIVIAIGRAAVVRIVVPRTAPQSVLPAPW